MNKPNNLRGDLLKDVRLIAPAHSLTSGAMFGLSRQILDHFRDRIELSQIQGTIMNYFVRKFGVNET